MLTITHEAAEFIAESRQETGAPDSYGVRIFPALPPGEETPTVAVAFVPEPKAGDQVTEQEGVTAYLAPELTEALDSATLDATVDAGVKELVLSR